MEKVGVGASREVWCWPTATVLRMYSSRWLAGPRLEPHGVRDSRLVVLKAELREKRPYWDESRVWDPFSLWASSFGILQSTPSLTSTFIGSGTSQVRLAAMLQWALVLAAQFWYWLRKPALMSEAAARMETQTATTTPTPRTGAASRRGLTRACLLSSKSSWEMLMQMHAETSYSFCSKSQTR